MDWKRIITSVVTGALGYGAAYYVYAGRTQTSTPVESHTPSLEEKLQDPLEPFHSSTSLANCPELTCPEPQLQIIREPIPVEVCGGKPVQGTVCHLASNGVLHGAASRGFGISCKYDETSGKLTEITRRLGNDIGTNANR